MKEVKHGVVSVSLPESVRLPARSGKMSPKEVSRLLKAPHGLSTAAEHAAEELQKADPSFLAPKGVTPESLRQHGAEALRMEGVIHDLTVVLQTLKQGKLLIDHECYLQLRQLKDFVRMQAKHNPSLLVSFGLMLELFEKSVTTRKQNLSFARRLAKEAQREEDNTPTAPEERPPSNVVKLTEAAG